MRGSYDARKILHGLIDTRIHTLTGRPNTILGLEGDTVLVATTRSPTGQPVPIAWVQDALDRLAVDGEIEISVRVGRISQRVRRRGSRRARRH
jgi:hypothetical protein